MDAPGTQTLLATHLQTSVTKTIGEVGLGGRFISHQSCLLVPENKNLETLPDYKLLNIPKSEQNVKSG